MVLLVGLMIPAAYAAPESWQKTEVIHTEIGDFEIETTLIVYNSAVRSNARSAEKTQTVKYASKVVAEVTLFADFGYNGTTVWVISASGSHTTYDGWSYSGEKITKSGGTAKLSAKLTHSRYEDVPINISLTCSPTGQIS